MCRGPSKVLYLKGVTRMDEGIDAYSSPISIGLDPGFGATKAAYIGREGVQVVMVPSVVGVGSTDLGLLSVGNLGRRRRSRQPDRVAFEEIAYLVGENVARYARPVERMDFLRLSDGPELRALFYDVVFRLLSEGRHRANIMVGLPVEVMADRQRARATLRALRRWMAARHHVGDRQSTRSINSTRDEPTGTNLTVSLQGSYSTYRTTLPPR